VTGKDRQEMLERSLGISVHALKVYFNFICLFYLFVCLFRGIKNKIKRRKKVIPQLLLPCERQAYISSDSL